MIKDRPAVAAATRTNWLVVAPLFITAFVTSLSGAYFLAFPSGYQGGRNPWYNVIVLFERHTWSDIHKWSGLLMIGLAVLHLVLHWDYVVRISKRIGKRLVGKASQLNPRSRFNVVINILVGLAFLVAAVTGIYFLFVPGGRWTFDPMLLWSKTTWDLMHTWAGVTLISAAVVHFYIHWRWVKNISHKMVVSYVRLGRPDSGLEDKVLAASENRL